MRRAWLVALAVLAGCDRAPSAASPPVSYVSAAQAAPEAGGTKLAYTHTVEAEVGPAWVERHFAAAQTACKAPCVVLNSAFDQPPDGVSRPSASLTARMPHDALPAFRAAVSAVLPGEPAPGVAIRSQETRAEDLERSIADGGRRVQQLRDYRERLTALATRPDTQVSDLIKAAEALSAVQSQLEVAEGEQRGLQERVDTELITVRWAATTPSAGAWGPVTDAVTGAGATLGVATGVMLTGTLFVLPWAPVLVLFVFAIRWIRNRWWRRA